jgi:hypothetical protein
MLRVEVVESRVGRAHVRHAASLGVLLPQQKGLGHEEQSGKGSKRRDEGVGRTGPGTAKSLAASAAVPVASTVRHDVPGQRRHGDMCFFVGHARLQAGAWRRVLSWTVGGGRLEGRRTAVRLELPRLAGGPVRGLHVQCLCVAVELVVMVWRKRRRRVGVVVLGAGVGGRAPSHLKACLAPPWVAVVRRAVWRFGGADGERWRGLGVDIGVGSDSGACSNAAKC